MSTYSMIMKFFFAKFKTQLTLFYVIIIIIPACLRPIGTYRPPRRMKAPHTLLICSLVLTHFLHREALMINRRYSNMNLNNFKTYFIYIYLTTLNECNMDFIYEYVTFQRSYEYHYDIHSKPASRSLMTQQSSITYQTFANLNINGIVNRLSTFNETTAPRSVYPTGQCAN